MKILSCLICFVWYHLRLLNILICWKRQFWTFSFHVLQVWLAKTSKWWRNEIIFSGISWTWVLQLFFEENYFFLTTQRVKFCVIRFWRSSKHFKICIFIDGTAKDKTWCKGESEAVDWDGTTCRVFWCGSSQVLPWNHFSSKSFRLNHRAEVFCAIGNHIHFSSYGVIFFVVHLTSFDCPSGSLRDKVNFFCCSND